MKAKRSRTREKKRIMSTWNGLGRETILSYPCYQDAHCCVTYLYTWYMYSTIERRKVNFSWMLPNTQSVLKQKHVKYNWESWVVSNNTTFRDTICIPIRFVRYASHKIRSCLRRKHFCRYVMHMMHQKSLVSYKLALQVTHGLCLQW